MMDFRWKNYQPNEQPLNNEQFIAPVIGSEFEQQRMNDRAELDRLKNELAQVDARIAQIDKELPAAEQEVEIAAKRAEIGDFSAYDNMRGRGAQNADPTGIENELFNAEKLTWGLKSKSGEEKEIAKANIEATLRRAEEWADKTGGKLPMS